MDNRRDANREEENEKNQPKTRQDETSTHTHTHTHTHTSFVYSTDLFFHTHWIQIHFSAFFFLSYLFIII
jgi:hypothetical protein